MFVRKIRILIRGTLQGGCAVKIWLAIIAGSVLSIVVLWLTSLPLGIPGEWYWERAALEPDTFWNLIGGVVAAGLFIVFVILGRQRFEMCLLKSRPMKTMEVAAWMAGLVLFSFAWFWIVQEISPIKNRLGKSPFVLYYVSSSGYFTHARYHEPGSYKLLSGYEDLMRKGDVLHMGTHPPGLIVVFQGLISICQASPQLATILDVTQPGSFREACEVIAANMMRGKAPRLLQALDRQVLWLATLLVILSASLTVIPLFGLLSRRCVVTNAWTFAALWPSMPAVAIFVPKSDAMFPLISATLLWLWLIAWDRRSPFLALLAGIVTWCGLMCSLAFLPVILVAGTLTFGSVLVRGVWSRSPSVIASNQDSTSEGDLPIDPLPVIGMRRGLCILAVGLGIAVPTFLLWYFTHLNMLNVWLLNYRNHAGFYGQYTRTYWKWLLLNPLELCIAAGFPLTLLAMRSCWNLLCRFRSNQPTLSADSRVAVGSILFVWGLLWLTGKNSGEAARLWILFFPWLVWLACIQFEAVSTCYLSFSSRHRWTIGLLIVQFAVCLFTVSRVSGFHLETG